MPRAKRSPVKKCAIDIGILNSPAGCSSVTKTPSTKYMRKKIYLQQPPDHVSFGGINFTILNKTNAVIEHELQTVTLFYSRLQKSLRLQLETFSTSTVLELSPCDVSSSVLSSCLSPSFSWTFIMVTPDHDEVHFEFGRKLSNFPIINASLYLNQFFPNVETLENVNTHGTNKKEKFLFFKNIKNYQTDSYNSLNVNVEHLVPTLRNYQTRAVKWMLRRECPKVMFQNRDWASSICQEVVTEKHVLYFNKYSGGLSLFGLSGEPAALPKGGILADEMGLGKTVVVIALVLNHGRGDDDREGSDCIEPRLTLAEAGAVVVKDEVNIDTDVVQSNSETSLSKDEKLKLDNSKGKMLRKALNDWYESTLAEYKTTSSRKRPKLSEDVLKCVCGGVDGSGQCVQCPHCFLYQHMSCVGFDEEFRYFCPNCWSKQKLVRSGATLIIAPTVICHQWEEEIEKHVRSGAFEHGVHVYTGVKGGFIQPSVLATYDVVITTYDVLRAELNFATPNDSTRTLRHDERFLRQCSPLTQIQWWRVCLDEAQMVESSMSIVNQMAKMIPGVNRWAVTGTPIQRSLDDLYYFVEYLLMEPFCDKTMWRDLLLLPYLNDNQEPLLRFLSDVFWRSSKADVVVELQLPEQKIEKHFIKFTAIEENFYKREHEASATKFSNMVCVKNYSLTQPLSSLDVPSLSALLAPLLNLRQACSHPQAVHGHRIVTQTGSMTLTELLTYLCNKTKVECEDAMRIHISALNGLAGLHCIEAEWPAAVEYYREVLQLAEEHKNKIHVDSLQLIHSMTNLAEVLACHPENIPPTLRDDSLRQDAAELEKKYLQKSLDELTVSQKDVKELSSEAKALISTFHTGPTVWWNRLLHFLTLEGLADTLIDNINAALSINESEKKEVKLFSAQISSVKGLETVVRLWLEDMEMQYKVVRAKMKELESFSRMELVNKAVACHLRTSPLEEKGGKCPLCKCEAKLLEYECALFSVKRKRLKKEYDRVLDGAQTKGSWKQHNAEIAVMAIHSYSRNKSGVEEYCVKDGRTHAKLLAVRKKEFKQLRVVWMSLNHHIQALDELSMSKIRLRLKLDGEPMPPKKQNALRLTSTNKTETIYIIEQFQVQPMLAQLVNEQALAKSNVTKKYGTLRYLKSLGQEKAMDPCPVCKSVLESEWCVLQCGHSFCLDCIQRLFDRHMRQSVHCPVCREVTRSADLSFVDLKHNREASDIDVVGEHSTKVDAIVREVLRLRKLNPDVKILIFSSWAIVLKILSFALDQNKVLYRRIPGHKYSEHLQQFKDPEGGVTVLLLPVKWGSKGLNLVEATHVFLVEPLMNPADELQAINRVHRIGQTKQTFVHRFLISGTIEEKIYSTVSQATDKWDSSDKRVTIADIQDLFVIKN